MVIKKKIIILIGIFISFSLLSLGAYFFYNGFSREHRPVKDPRGDSEFMCKRVIIGFQESATSEMVQSAIKSVQGKIVGSIPVIRVYQISIPGRCDAETVLHAIEILENNPAVEYAEPDHVMYLLD